MKGTYKDHPVEPQDHFQAEQKLEHIVKSIIQIVSFNTVSKLLLLKERALTCFLDCPYQYAGPLLASGNTVVQLQCI